MEQAIPINSHKSSMCSMQSSSHHFQSRKSSQHFQEGSFGGANPNSVPCSQRDQGQSHASRPSEEEMNLELFKQQLKLILPQGQPFQIEDGLMTGGASTQMSTCVKERNGGKSRQISIHTNAGGVSEFEEKQDLYSTTQTLKRGGKSSFLTQTNTTFISNVEGEPSSQSVEQKFNEGAKAFFSEVEQIKRRVQKGLLMNNGDGRLKLRPTLKKKIRTAIEDPAEIPMNVYYLIVSYDTRLFKQLVTSSRGLRKHLLFFLQSCVRQSLVPQFCSAYSPFFSLQKVSLELTPISFCHENGVRLDAVLKFKLEDKCRKFEGQSLQFGFVFRYDQAKEEEFQTNYQMDVYSQQQQRWLWLHKDECQFHGYSDQRAYTIPIAPVCQNDQVEIAITLLSLSGSLDLTSVRFLPMASSKQPKQSDVRDYNRMKHMGPQRDLFQKYFADLHRVCEVEDTVVEWFLEEYARAMSLRQHVERKVNLDQFKDQFEVLKAELGGIDFSVWKIQLKAKRNCTKEIKYYEELRMEVRVAQDRKEELTNEVKRSGFLIDRGSRVELREGDLLIIYISMGGFEK